MNQKIPFLFIIIICAAVACTGFVHPVQATAAQMIMMNRIGIF